MKLETQLPLAQIFFKHWSQPDREIGVVVAVAQFRRSFDGRFFATRKPPEMRFEDMFTADPACSALHTEQDIAPGKAATDLIIRGAASSPGGKDMTDWPVSIAIAERLFHSFHVRGPVLWERNNAGRRWQQTAPARVSKVAIDFSFAFGGTLNDDQGKPLDFLPENPAGLGFANKGWLDQRDTPFRAPQIGLLAEWIAADPLSRLSIVGSGPIAKTWLPRRALAGTFDNEWLRDRHPRMPRDHDIAFWNAAPAPLQIAPFLKGDEVIILNGFSVDGRIQVDLPGTALVLEARGDETQALVMTLDTVEVDLSSGAKEKDILRIVWRAQIEAPERFSHGRLVPVSTEQLQETP